MSTAEKRYGDELERSLLMILTKEGGDILLTLSNDFLPF